MNIESRISIPPDVDATAEAVSKSCGISKPRVLGTFARYGQLAGSEAILGPLGKTLGDVMSDPFPAGTAKPRSSAVLGTEGASRKAARINRPAGISKLRRAA